MSEQPYDYAAERHDAEAHATYDDELPRWIERSVYNTDDWPTRNELRDQD